MLTKEPKNVNFSVFIVLCYSFTFMLLQNVIKTIVNLVLVSTAVARMVC